MANTALALLPFFFHPPSLSLLSSQLGDLVPPGSAAGGAAPSSGTDPGADGVGDGSGGTPREGGRWPPRHAHPAPSASAGGSGAPPPPHSYHGGRNGVERPKHAVLADTIAELKDLRRR